MVRPGMRGKRAPRFSTVAFRLVLGFIAALPFTGVLQGDRSGARPADPPPLTRFSFVPLESKVLPGTSSEKASSPSCNGTIKDIDRLGRLAIVSTFYQNACYTGATYSHADFRVERGEFSSKSATPEATVKVSTRSPLEAYRLHGPSRKASKFLASRHVVFYEFAGAADHAVYLFDGNALTKLVDVPASRIRSGGFTKIGEIDASNISGSAVFVIAPAGLRLSAYTELGPDVEAARLARTPLGVIDAFRVRVPGTPFDTRLDFSAAPASHGNLYGRTKAFFPVLNGSGGHGVIWQDQKTRVVRVTWLLDLNRPRTLALPLRHRDRLAAAASDGRGTLFYLTVEESKRGEHSARRMTLYRATEGGALQKLVNPDSGPRGLNVTSFSASDVASLAVSGDKLGLIIGRTMHKSGDGLNHQGAIAVLFDAGSLSTLRNLGQTSGHSFDNELSVDPSGDFLGLDLGDNYPRGVHLHRFNPASRGSRVVFTFKTRHGQQARSPAGRIYPLYDELSVGGKAFYKWSNDNATYTELGGVVQGKAGYTVVFATEFSPAGRALDNGRTGAPLNDARNIGLVQVVPDFHTRARWGSVVPDNAVVSSGQTESGGFYTFGGAWSPQRNAGVVRLTRYTDPAHENVTRLKVVPRPDASALLVWENWGVHYADTMAMKISHAGAILAGPVSLGSHVRLGRTDEPLSRPEGVYLFAGDRAAGRINVTLIRD